LVKNNVKRYFLQLFVIDKLNNLKINSGEKADYKSSAGIYKYKHKESDKSYIGSAFNFKDRIKSHKDQFRNSENKFYKFIAETAGWDSLDYSILYVEPNLLKEFKSLNPLYNLSKGEIIFLVHITELMPAVKNNCKK
jgi:excinuclease UvrABC nuclease subunit